MHSLDTDILGQIKTDRNSIASHYLKETVHIGIGKVN